MSERVTIGVPVYRGEAFLEETLRAIEAQTHSDFEVMISIDGPDPACEEIAARFLGDSRFRVVVQPERLGWVGNINWLLGRVEGDFWYFHQQDDLTDPEYLEVLVAHALANPDAAVVYCDIIAFGQIRKPLAPASSVTGPTAYMRMMTLLHEHFPAVAFRGVTRAAAVREAGPIPTNEFGDFGSDMCWVAGAARWGELLRVPRPLYRKRYHAENTHSKWWSRPKATRLRAWPTHCVNMLEQAMRIEATIQERRMLWLAAVERLASPQAAGHFLPVAELTRADRESLFDAFMDRSRASPALDLPTMLEARWREIHDWARGFYWKPSGEPIAIEDFGPKLVEAGAPFNVQPDGSFAIWARVSRWAEPGMRLRLGDKALETVARGRLLTASVDRFSTEMAGDLPLVVIDCEESVRSESVVLQIR